MGLPPISLSQYTDEYPAGFPGDLADIGLKDTISRQNTGTKNIPFGAAVISGPAIGTETDGCAAYDGASRVIGFAKSDYALHPIIGGLDPTNTAQLAYLPGDTVQVVRDARMRQLAPANVNPGNPVTVDANGVVNSGGTAVPGAVWESKTSQGQIGWIQILIV